MIKVIFLLFFTLLTAPALAAEPVNFVIVPNDSNINFKTTYEGDVVVGKFGKFSGDINFHPEALDKSTVKIHVGTDSIESDYDYAVDTLTTEGWFNPDEFPQAMFESGSFKSLGNNKYEAHGFLTIRKTKQPIKLSFSLDKFDEKSAIVIGTAKLLRSSYDLGWEETDKLKDEVEIDFKVTANAK
jgi:cytochrome b561